MIRNLLIGEGAYHLKSSRRCLGSSHVVCALTRIRLELSASWRDSLSCSSFYENQQWSLSLSPWYSIRRKILMRLYAVSDANGLRMDACGITALPDRPQSRSNCSHPGVDISFRWANTICPDCLSRRRSNFSWEDRLLLSWRSRWIRFWWC